MDFSLAAWRDTSAMGKSTSAIALAFFGDHVLTPFFRTASRSRILLRGWKRGPDVAFGEVDMHQPCVVAELFATFFQKDYCPLEAKVSLKQARFMDHVFPWLGVIGRMGCSSFSGHDEELATESSERQHVS